jgi:hypothetical protein
MTPQHALEQLIVCHFKFHPLGSSMGMKTYTTCTLCLTEWVTYFYPLFDQHPV